jgi:cytidylate kinase
MMYANIPLITVDGPVGSGKGSLCVMLAKTLNFHLLDSGALYRVLALAVTRNNIDITNQSAIEKLALNLNIKFIEHVPAEPAAIILDNQDVSYLIRTEECGELASKVAGYKVVRDALMERQRAFLTEPGLIADGRDMGTIVFPNAQVKFFLTASQEVRAQRRFNQLKNQGLNVDLLKILEEIKRRDERDTNRPLAPLKPADDAIIIDSSNMTIEQVSKYMLDTIHAKGFKSAVSTD